MHHLIQLFILFLLYKLWDISHSQKVYKIKKVDYFMNV